MLTIHITEQELYDEATGEFIQIKEQTIQLKHSLISLSKWESIWKKPFLGSEVKTEEETLDYIRCMTITPNVPYEAYYGIGVNEMMKINEYVESSLTATFFSEESNKQFNKEIITSELIYYWMITHQIPFSCEKWHLSRLITLIRVCGAKNSPKKKMSTSEIIARNKELNAARRKKYGSRG